MANQNKDCDLRSCFMCGNCIPGWRELIAVKKRTISFKKGQLIFSEGDKVDGIYFLSAGAAKVHKQWVGQKELVIRFTKVGDVLGHRGLGAGDIYPVSATALIESKACFISNQFLETMLSVDHAFTYQFLQFYSRELQKAEMRMRNLALMEVKGRIAGTLLELLDVFGTDKHGYINVPVTRQDIAAYSGTTYETVFKFLKTLTTAKTIGTSGKSIRIHNVDRLYKVIKNAK